MTRNAPKDLSSKKPETKRFYFLVCGTVMFYPKDVPIPEGGTPDVASLPVNGILTNESGQLPVSALADAKLTLVQAMQDKIGHQEAVEVVDVQLGNIVKLGHMFPSEFHDLQVQKAPEPTAEDVAPAKVV